MGEAGGGLSSMLPDTPAAISLMAAADNAVIPFQPFEESVFNSGPGNMRNYNDGI